MYLERIFLIGCDIRCCAPSFSMFSYVDTSGISMRWTFASKNPNENSFVLNIHVPRMPSRTFLFLWRDISNEFIELTICSALNDVLHIQYYGFLWQIVTGMIIFYLFLVVITYATFRKRLIEFIFTVLM